MTRRKDRERFRFRKRLDPGYQGFRGYQPRPESKPELRTLTCTVCGRKRNVPPDTAEEGFVCSTCRAERGEETA